jgi:DNA-binding transcriptional LysR family regulator
MPGLVLTVAIGNTAEILPRLEAGDLDVVLATLPVPPSRALSTTRLLADPLLALLPASSALAGEGPINAKALGALPLILYEEGGNTRAATDAWFRQAGVKPEPAMELGSVEAIKTLVSSGLGAAVLPALALREPPPGTVTRALRPAASRSLGCVIRKEKVLDRGLRLFLTELNRSVGD